MDEVVAQVVQCGRGALIAKFDLKTAYRNIPDHPDDRHFLSTELDQQLFVDTVL